MKKIAYLVMLLGFMPMLQAWAQEAGQTKASAIKFLDMTIPGSKFKYNKDPYWRKWGDVIKDTQDVNNECKFKYIVEFPYSERKEYGRIIEYYNNFTANNYLEFEKVSEVKRILSQVSLYYVGDGKLDTTHFSFSSEQTAIRVAYAIEFLRQQCDAAAETGF